MSAWTLDYNGDERTFAAWGLGGLKRSLRSQDADVVTFTQPGAAFDADPLFPFEASIVIKKDGVRWFEGVVMEPKRTGGPDREDLHYTVLGPWYWLDTLVHQQQWKSYDNATQGLVTLSKSHLLLGLDAVGNRLDTGEQIQEALDYAIATGRPIQYSAASLPALNVPLYEAREITVAEVIRMMLRWSPDAATWWDYTTSPPTLHIKRRADLDTVQHALAVPAHEVEIIARKDLQAPAVVIQYEITNQVDGQAYVSVSVDKFPLTATGQEARAVILTVNLQGFSAAIAKADILTQAIDTASGAWWEAKLPWLSEAEMDSWSISGIVRQSALPNELIEGQIPPWMSAVWARETITATVSFTKVDGTTGTRPVSVNLVATDATTGKYTNLTLVEGGEPVPVGLAEAFHSAVNVLQYEGRLPIEEEEVSSQIRVGHLLNLTGGRAEWATMGALVWQVEEDVDTGLTTVHFGPTAHLGIPDLLELLRVDRNRQIFTSPKAMTDGTGGNANQIELGKATPNNAADAGVDKMRRQVWTAQSGSHLVDINTADATGGGQERQLRIREVSVCVTDSEGNHEEKKMLVLASEPY